MESLQAWKAASSFKTELCIYSSKNYLIVHNFAMYYIDLKIIMSEGDLKDHLI